MTARQLRRRADHQARKQARKAQQQAEPAAAPETAAPLTRAEVNRQNAQHSTGPRTPEGKLASSRNSFQHGLYAKQLVLPGEDPAELDALRQDLRREHQPANTTEAILVNELAEHYWRLRRMRKLEARIMGTGTLDELERGLRLLPLIQRTMASAERGFHKALVALRQLQKGRLAQAAPATRHPQPEPPGFVPEKHEVPLESVSQKPTEAAAPQENYGFVSQSARAVIPPAAFPNDLAIRTEDSARLVEAA
jgi:hypothetical protein